MNILGFLSRAPRPPLPVVGDPKCCFWVNGGGTLANLRDLERALDTMPYETFTYHVNDKKNDFAVWVRDALHEDELADRIGRFRTQRNIKKTVASYITKRYAV